ncbi:MAG: c-type cytochrome [Planctomycetes bacterium]|nr:c-type cytochrome [Planctomycetota bacterium]
MLGDPSLTIGLPGMGALSIQEIKQWLANPRNHIVLQVELPLGLAQGQNDIKGLKENPLTRAKIELGRQLFFDGRLSKDGSISCASCHSPSAGYAAHTQFGIGVGGQQGGRNSPVAYNRILSDKQFWDGRAASLEEQAKGPIANPIEMANTHEICIKSLQEIEGYRIQFEKVFGELNIDNVAKAIASFERVIVSGPSKFDHLVDWETYAQLSADDLKEDHDLRVAYDRAKAGAMANPISASAKRGRDLYFGKASCSACHVGPNLTDEKYHNIGVGMKVEKPDLGRSVISNNDKERGAFKTPTVRNVALSAPYMHDGSMKTLREVVDFYDRGGEPNPNLDEKIKKLNLNEQEKQDLVAFMEACTGDFPRVERGRLPGK